MNTSILQWNVQGLRRKKDEFRDLIQTYKASIVALHETKLSQDFNIRISYSNILSKNGHYNQDQHGPCKKRQQ